MNYFLFTYAPISVMNFKIISPLKAQTFLVMLFYTWLFMMGFPNNSVSVTKSLNTSEFLRGVDAYV